MDTIISADDVVHYLKSWDAHAKKCAWNDLIGLIEDANAKNPYSQKDPNHFMWMEQSNINVPMLYVCCIYLYKYVCDHKLDTILFATRDCVHMVRIFQKLFPDVNAVYFNCSRNMLTRAATEHNVYYKKYVQSLIKTDVEHCIYCDIHGTAIRIFNYFEQEFGSVPHAMLLSSSYREYKDFPKTCVKYHEAGKLKNIIFDCRGTSIEMLNFATEGTLQNYDKNGVVRDPPEYDVRKLEPYHVCIQYILSNIKPWNTKKTPIGDIDFDNLSGLIRRIARTIADGSPVLLDFIKHPGKH